MRILIALSNKILSEAIKFLLHHSGSKDKIATALLSEGNGIIKQTKPEVILLDYYSLRKMMKEDNGSNSKVLIIENGMEKEEMVPLIMRKKISGIISKNCSIKMLLKAISVVSRGEVWIDNSTVKLIIDNNAFKAGETVKLSSKENEVVNLLKDGCSNKEIAHNLRISEQTVKSHLNRIYRKLNVYSRTELMAHYNFGQ